ncbi:MAG: S-layer homology domain-containing protein [Chloroflexota bacterium]
MLRHYDSYSYTNNTNQAQCVTVQLDAGSCTGQRYLFSAAYLGEFNPNNMCANYLADIGASPNPVGSYAFTVPAGANFVVVVHEVTTGAGCPGYALTVSSCNTGITGCAINFTDVPPEQTFYPFVHCLACGGVVSGYSDGTFRPNNNLTRAQLAKIVSNAAGFSDPASGQLFQDIVPANTFYVWVQRLASRGYISGYPCGGPGEPCGSGNLPYFRPGNNATRGQISKIVSNAAGFNEPPADNQIFADVPPSSTFYEWIQRLASRSIMSGYPCGGPGEPCGAGNLPYFRPGNNATRGQTSKIVANTFYPNCYSAAEGRPGGQSSK